MKQHILYIEMKRKKVDKSDCTTEVSDALGQMEMMGSSGLKIYPSSCSSFISHIFLTTLSYTL